MIDRVERNALRGRLASLINAIFSASIMALGLVAGLVAEHDWHLLMWLGGVPPIALALFAYVLIPASVDHRHDAAPATRLPVLELFAPGLRRRTVMLAAMTGLNFFAYQAYSGWLTTYLHDVRGLSAFQAGELVAWNFSANIVGGFFWGWAADRWGRCPGRPAFPLRT